ncbi:hypothetical protein [Arhodomonas sp. KWT]|nr:hypothetical protein [Arhodomonas sp. KWT]
MHRLILALAALLAVQIAVTAAVWGTAPTAATPITPDTAIDTG